MDSISDGATIRIGLRNIGYRLKDDPQYCGIKEYSLKINKKTQIIISFSNPEESAKKIAKIMLANKVKKYEIFNGELIDHNTKKWESCDNIPNGGFELFKKTLEEKFTEQN